MPSKKKSPPGKTAAAPEAELPGEAVDTGSQVPIVVAIGASAGGLEALEHFFAVMPHDCGLSYVVIMHLLPEGPALLPALLRRYTPMEVVAIEDEMPIVANTVYVLSGGWDLTLDGGRLQLRELAVSPKPHHPIDRFFNSLALELAERAVAVVLSGSGTDGSEGVKKVRATGGIVLVQDPESATSPGMPRSAIDTGAADFVLAADQLPEKIAEIARGTCTLSPRACRTTTLDEELQTICTIVKARTGNDFSSYKVNTVLRRIERRMSVHDTGGIGKYIVLLRDNPLEAQALSQDILIGVTSFFRDPEAFEVLRQEVLPRLFADRNPDDPVRIWHACCATGEEVYSMAILIQEYLDERKLDAKVQLFATDIDEAAISQARAGLYHDDVVADLGEERLKRFFIKSGHRWQVSKALREMIVFAHHNLLKDPPFSRLDLLVCRNFLIYLNPDMQKRLIPLFHRVLKPGGVLFLGASESVGRHSELFSSLDKKWRFYTRRECGGRVETVFPFTASIRRPSGIGRSIAPATEEESGPGAFAEKLLMKRYSPPCVVVNEKYQVVHVSTRTERFLEVPVGEPTRDILKMAREDLRPPLRAAIYKAFAEEKEVIFRGVKVVIDGGEMTVNVQVEPFQTPTSGKLVMVVFETAAPPATVALPVEGAESGAGDEASRETLIRQLEDQLRITYEQLQSATEQLETSNEGFLSANEELISMNEEFQSANEELQSTNEQMETSKEELQAVNEELVTVNFELQGKVEELNQATSDLENLFANSEVATIFLDRRLAIKRFSPAMAFIFNLIPADIGRPFRHLTGTIDWPDLVRDAENVLDKAIPLEREVTALADGRCFIMRVLPYRGTAGTVEGIVVTLIDITERKRAEEAHARLAEIVESSDDAIIAKDLDGTILTWNAGAQRMFGYRVDEAVGRPIAMLIPAELQREEEEILRRLAAGERVEHYETARLDSDGRRLEVSVTVSPITSAGRIVGASKIVRDITDRKRAEEALRRYELLARHSRDIILFVGRDDGRILEANDAASNAYGYRHEELLGLAIKDLREPESKELTVAQMAEADTGGILFESVHRRKDGTVFPVEVSSQGATIGGIRTLISVIRDITERKCGEEEIRRHVEELRAQNVELTRLNSVMEGRELRMIELKQMVNELYVQSGQSPRFPLDFDEVLP
jgi:two-component system, chemotaxis family, CheB/CheR fusion protein